MSSKVFLVDGSGYIFRAFYAVQSLSTKDGFPTNALYGFARMLGKLLQDAESDHVIVVFDAGRKTFRNDLYEKYKANRAECPQDLSVQMPFFREICKALGLQTIESPGFEADDVIGTLVDRFVRGGHETVIVSGDKDLMQLVGDRVTIWDTMKDKRFGRAGVKEKFGVEPELVVEVLALTGDSSDNIPGLKGAGPKTALQLIEKYGTVEKVIAGTNDIRSDASIRNRNKIAETIEADPEILRLSRKLVEICREAPVSVEIEGQLVSASDVSDNELFGSALRKAPREEQLKELFARFEFTSLLKELNLRPPRGAEKERAAHTYHTVWADLLPDFITTLSAQKEISFDVETTSLDTFEAEVVGVAFCWSENEAWYLPVGHTHVPEGKTQATWSAALSVLKPILENRDIRKCGQNLKYDVGVFAQQGVEVQGIDFDTMVAAYLLNPDKGSYNLTRLSQDYLGRNPIEYKELVSTSDTFAGVSIEDATRYSAEDAHFAWLLKEHLRPILEARDLTRVFRDIEMPLVPVLSKMERSGVKIDTKLLANLSEEFGSELEQIRLRLYEVAGCEFNLNSPKQLADVLFVKLGISTKGIKKTKTGFSTDSSVLEQLSYSYDFPKELLRYRHLQKLKGTYIDSLPAQISKVTGRLHSRFNQTVTGTGRLSSSDPNLQNIPVQTEEGRRIRRAFVAEPGNVLISADYSQIELRLLAHMSEDEALIDAFQNDIDIHSKTAREILAIPENEEVTPEMRRIGKTMNFGIIYGMSGFRLARELGTPVHLGNQYIEKYFARYPGVKKLFAKLEADAASLGEVTTIFGRKRVLTDLDMSGRDRGFQNRVAVNAPIQGTAADIVKLAMISIAEVIRKESPPYFLTLQIHDELVFECEASFADRAKAVIKSHMEQVAKLRVPLKVDVGVGLNWQEAH